MPTYNRTQRLSDNIISVRPLPAQEFSLVRGYQYVSKGVPPNKIFANDGLIAPDGTSISSNAVFFETSVDNRSNPPIFTQRVLDSSTDISSDAVLVNQYEDFYKFQYPGVVDLSIEDLDETFRKKIQIKKTQEPLSSMVSCTVYDFIQTSGDITQSDYKYQSSSGLWSPNQWASFLVDIDKDLGSTIDNTFQNNIFNGYRTSSASTKLKIKGVQRGLASVFAQVVLNGQDLGFCFPGFVIDIDVVQGPPDPIGSKWCIMVDIEPAFSATDGTTYYKKRIVVTDPIPQQNNNLLPYD
jgi:hypothetical protein|tara:strand:+ start:2755 stop:3642 length:888 start_codon:yes stop_codon:yes gene_type:complete